MPSNTQGWAATRDWIADHFDAKAPSWEALTSDRPLGRIRDTVRAGRRQMQETILGWLPESLEGRRVLDAGCGPGGLSLAMAARGAEVLGVDISDPLIQVARSRAAESGVSSAVRFEVGDMLSESLTDFDHVVGMDSLIHYDPIQLHHAVEHFSRRATKSIVFTFAPRTPLLFAMHRVGQFLPRSNRSPSIEPMSEKALHRGLLEALGGRWGIGRTHRVRSGFYTSQALELVAVP